MAETTVELVLRAKNEAAKVLDEVTKQVTSVTKSIKTLVSEGSSSARPTYLNNMSASLGKVYQALKTTNAEFNVLKAFRLSTLTRSIRTMTQEVKKAEEQVKDLVSAYQDTADLGDKIAQGFAIPAAVSTAASASYASYSRSIGEVNTLLDGTIERQQLLESEVLAVSSAYGIEASEVAQGYYNALSSGAVTSADAVDFLQVAAKTAIGGVTDLGTAVSGITTILNAFEQNSSQADVAANALFVGMRAGTTTVGELASYMAEAAPIANQLGVSFQELISATAAMTTAGVQTSQAFTRIRAAMDQIIAKEEINAIFQDMGYESSAAAIRANGLGFALDAVWEAAGKSEQQLAKLLGSTEAMQSVLLLTGASADQFATILRSMESDTEALNTAFGAMNQTFGVQVSLALNDAKIAFIQLGEAMVPIASIVLGVIRSISQFVTYVSTEFPLLTSIVISLGAAFIGIGLIIGTFMAIYGRLGAVLVIGIQVIKNVTASVIAANVSFATLLGTVTRLIPQLALFASAFSLWKAIEEAYKYQEALSALEDTANKASKELEVTRKAFPDAADMNVDDMIDYNSLTQEQIDQLQEMIAMRVRMNQLEITTLVNQEDISKADWERINALRAQNKVLIDNNTTIREVEAQRNSEYLSYTSEQLQAEKYRINTLIGENRRLYDAAIQANDPEAVENLNKKYQILTASLKAVSAAITDGSAAANTVLDELGLLAEGYEKTSEAASDFRNNAQKALDIEFGAALDSLGLYQQGLDSAYSSGVIGAEEYLSASRNLVDTRLEIERQYQEDVRTLFSQERNIRLQEINASEDDETTKQSKRRELQRETEQFVVESHGKEAEAARSARDNAYQAYLDYANKVQALQQEIEQTEMERENTIRDLRRKGFTDYEAYKDRESEIAELNGRIQSEIDKGNYDAAEKYAREQIRLAQQLSNEVKDGEKVIVSEQQAISNAISATEQGYDNLLVAQRAQKAEAEAQAQLQLALYQSLDATLRNIQATMIALATGSELNIEISDNAADVETALDNYRNIVDQGVQVDLKPKLDESESQKTVDEVGQTVNQAEDQYGSVRVAMYSDTGEFEQEVFTITEGTDWKSSVTVTADGGQYYATVSELTDEGFIVEGKPTLIRGDLEKFYADFESRTRANPPRAEVDINTNQTQQNVNDTVQQLDVNDLQTALDVDTTPATDGLEAFKKEANRTKTSSLHTIKVNNTAVEAAKASNQRDTSNVHTTYLRTVEQRATGGIMGSLRGFPRRRGFVSGAGTGTSDQIPAMLSNGEFVQKTAAVRKYGVGFMRMVNSLKLPTSLVDQLMGRSLPRFATGGSVGVSQATSSSGIGNLPEMSLNLSFDSGTTVQLQGSQDAVGQLIEELKKDARS